MRRTLTVLGIAVLALVAMGIALLASAGSANGIRLHGNANYFPIHQAIWLGLAVPLAVAAALFDYHHWRNHPWLTVMLYVFVCLLMASVFGFREINGSHRWVILGPVRIQPGELAKITCVLASAVFLDRAGWRIDMFWKGVVPAGLITAVLMGLAVIEPDFGTTMVLGATGGVLLFVAGMKWRYLISLGLGGLGGVGALVATNPNRMNRILSWVKGLLGMVAADGAEVVLSAKEKAAAHQLEQALVAIQRGGVTGVGFNKSMQKQYYLPEAHTDFIFAIGAEECGLVFSLILLALFITVFVCGVMIAVKSQDRLGRLIAFGVTFLIFFQAMFNIGVVTGCLPTKGLALPFESYGGTNLVTALVSIGLLFNVGRRIELPKPRPKSTISPVFPKQGGY